ncbi:LON peptidase substrate-binding domain-containing protein [Solimonas marina]|uniref:Peptidase S16 n=1 Tax=Solimonas marina TaxID=2714601 RepID=A0A969WCN2_9GAMM|nr:LON peptidase substrate-binding domain-containing protein [Solimonas marina]NKF22395.1 peptidase S16 [Solimonas marina]
MQTLDIPIFPLGTVLYPAGLLPLRIFEPRYVDMTKACIADDSVFGVCLIRAGFEVGTPAIPCEIGCTARIAEWDVPEPGLFTLSASGESVFRLLDRRTQVDGLIVGTVELREPAEPVGVPGAQQWMVELLQKLTIELGEQRFPQPSRFDDASWVAYRLLELMAITPERKQRLLELNDPLAVLTEVATLIRATGD